MSDSIDNRQEAIDTLKANYPSACYEQLREAVDAAIIALQSADPEQKMGKWIKKHGTINCSNCKQCSWTESFEATVRRFKYCPHCGAKMEVEE